MKLRSVGLNLVDFAKCSCATGILQRKSIFCSYNITTDLKAGAKPNDRESRNELRITSSNLRFFTRLPIRPRKIFVQMSSTLSISPSYLQPVSHRQQFKCQDTLVQILNLGGAGAVAPVGADPSSWVGQPTSKKPSSSRGHLSCVGFLREKTGKGDIDIDMQQGTDVQANQVYMVGREVGRYAVGWECNCVRKHAFTNHVLSYVLSAPIIENCMSK